MSASSLSFGTTHLARRVKALGNTSDGVFIQSASNNTVGGTAAGARNVISGNNRHGVFINSIFGTATATATATPPSSRTPRP